MNGTRLATLAAATFALGIVGGDAVAKEKAAPHLRYAKTYAEAVAEARDRHAVIFATFHKDN
jgi:hypothetical protein